MRDITVSYSNQAVAKMLLYEKDSIIKDIDVGKSLIMEIIEAYGYKHKQRRANERN